MKIEITIPTPSLRGLRGLTAAGFLVASAILLIAVGFATWLLFLAFCLLLLAIGLAWASITSVAERNAMTLEEALDLGAPARDEERKDAVLRGIKDLEYERGLGKISEQDYADLVRRYRSDAKRLLQNLDTSESSLRQQAIDLVESKFPTEASSLDKNFPDRGSSAIASESGDAQEHSSSPAPKDIQG